MLLVFRLLCPILKLDVWNVVEVFKIRCYYDEAVINSAIFISIPINFILRKYAFFVNKRESTILHLLVDSAPKVLVNNRELNPYEFGMMKAIEAGIDVRHCAICNWYPFCKLEFKEDVKDGNTGVKRIVPRLDNQLDKVRLASGCRYYAHNKSYVYSVLNQLRLLPYWEWKKGK